MLKGGASESTMVMTQEEIAAIAPRAHLDSAVYELKTLGPYRSGDFVKWTEDTLTTPHANVEDFVSLNLEGTRVTLHRSGVYRITVRMEISTDDDPREFIFTPIATADPARYATDANKKCVIESFFEEGVNCIQDSQVLNLDAGTEIQLVYKSPEVFTAPSGLNDQGRFSNDLQICRLSNYLMTAKPQWDQPSDLWKERNDRYDKFGKPVDGGAAPPPSKEEAEDQE